MFGTKFVTVLDENGNRSSSLITKRPGVRYILNASSISGGNSFAGISSRNIEALSLACFFFRISRRVNLVLFIQLLKLGLMNKMSAGA